MRLKSIPGKWTLTRALDLQHAELAAIVGGGGKTNLMFLLSDEWQGRVISTTTTRIFAQQTKLAPFTYVLKDPSQIKESEAVDISDALGKFQHCLVIGGLKGDKAYGVSPDLPEKLLALDGVSLVLVEADGSRMKPIKAPAEHEPAMPKGATLVVPMAGIEAVNEPISEIAHRPERLSQILGLAKESILSATDFGKLLCHEEGGLKRVPNAARVVPFINKIETAQQLEDARTAAGMALTEDRVTRVALGALKGSEKLIEVHRRVMAVILAAGQSVRMGDHKLALPWGETTILGATINNLKASWVHDILLVIGYKADQLSEIISDQIVTTVFNPDFIHGEMLSSLQAAIGSLPARTEAILVMLADQPMVGPMVIDEILKAYWRGEGTIIAPEFDGKRGNPVLFDREHFTEILDLPAGSAPRDVLRRRADEVYLVPVRTPTVLFDIDTPEDYQRWLP